MEGLHALSMSVLPVPSDECSTARIMSRHLQSLCVFWCKIQQCGNVDERRKELACCMRVGQHTQNQQGYDFPCLEAKKYLLAVFSDFLLNKEN